MATEEKSMPFIKNLASSDRKIRTEALNTLQTFLSAHASSSAALSPLDILKLWKGLFYALWMADRAIPQQNLCNDLAGLLDVFAANPRGAVPWLRGFWATMAREWTGIDVLRMNKFLLLVRRVLGASFAWMKKGDAAWDDARVADVLALLEEWPFATEEERDDADDLTPRMVPVGLRVHVLDVWIDEAERAGLLREEDVRGGEILEQINVLVVALEKATTATAVRIRAKEALADERFPWNESVAAKDESGADGIEGQGEDEDMADDESWDGFND